MTDLEARAGLMADLVACAAAARMCVWGGRGEALWQTLVHDRMTDPVACAATQCWH